MSANTATHENTVESRIKEAKAYQSMGLFSESIAVYEQILMDVPDLDPEAKTEIEQAMAAIHEDLDLAEDENIQGLSSEDLSIIKKTLSSEEGASAILDSASAFMELGLYTDALSEYERLLDMGHPIEETVPKMAECLFATQSPYKVQAHLEKIIQNRNLDGEAKAFVKFALGKEMEKRELKELAIELYRAAHELNPSDHIKGRLDALMTDQFSNSRYDYLLSKQLVSTEKLQQALALSKKRKRSVESILIENFKIEKEEIGKSLAYYFGCPFRTYNPDQPVPVELLGSLKKPFLLQERWVPLSWDKSGVEILIDDPKDLNKTDHIGALVKSKKISFSVAIREDIEAYIKHFFDGKRYEEQVPTDQPVNEMDLIPDVAFEEEEEEEAAEVADEFSEASGKIVRLVDQVIIAAYRKSSSDIHVEPSPITKSTSIRFRIDGVCQEYLSVPNSMVHGIISRIKIMAGLDIAERRLPQDGKIKFRRKGILPFELRVATIPTAGNFEDAVLRILPNYGAMKLNEMGLTDRNYEVLTKVLQMPYGLILAVGPTGSGKTTTLHSALAYINKPGIKIWTAEDPIEITQPGLRQVEAKPKIGLDFARIMRSFLRADPDVIMIGEMRDKETASIGIEASLTGHLVFSTLHTNSAPETITRLLDMGLNALNFSDAFLGVLAQRLVRRLCKKCRQAYHPSREEFDEIVKDYGEKSFPATGIEYTPDLQLYRPGKCERCNMTGYRGRLGIHELMEGTPEVKQMIKRQANTEELFERARQEGMTTLKQDGIMKTFQGLTDMKEVRRVCIS